MDSRKDVDAVPVDAVVRQSRESRCIRQHPRPGFQQLNYPISQPLSRSVNCEV